MATKMVSMKRSEKDKRKDMGQPCEVTAIEPDYPWGLTLNFDSDELEKLGIRQMPAVCTEYIMTAKVKVTTVSESASESETDGAEESRHMTLQVTDIALDGEKKP